MHRTSGWLASSHGSTRSVRARIEFTFQVTSFIAGED